ncbi:MAG: nucleotide exchange factor GrpE [Bacteroidota bacterium]
MNTEHNTPNEQDNLAEELKIQSEVEASEQAPIEEINEIDSLKKSLEESNDKYIRLYADFENYKRKMHKERLELISTASKEVILNLLPVLDDFDRAIQADKDKQLSEGIILIHQKLARNLAAKGLKEMECIGQEFNADIHDAITMIAAPNESMKGKVIDVLEKGYSINETVIRFAKVVVGN